MFSDPLPVGSDEYLAAVTKGIDCGCSVDSLVIKTVRHVPPSPMLDNWNVGFLSAREVTDKGNEPIFLLLL